MLTAETVSNAVKEVLVRVLELDLEPGDISDQMSLYSSTISLDSLRLLHLLVSLEESLGVVIEDEDVMEADLEVVGDIIKMAVDTLNRLGRVADTECEWTET